MTGLHRDIVPESRSIHTDGGDYINRDKHIYGDEVHGDKFAGDKHIYVGPTFPRPNYRHEIAHILAGYTAFVGRQDAWQRLTALSHRQEPGYLLVEAPAGYGKTAFMVELIRRHETEGWPQPTPRLLYFFIRHEGRRNTADAYLRGLNAQLITLLDEEGGVPSDLAALQNQFSYLWDRALATVTPQQPLLLLVDGLDEMATGQISIASELPAALADYVHVIVSSRPNPQPLAQVSAHHPLRGAAQMPLHRFTLSEVETLLSGHGMPAAQVPSFAPAILDLTGGEPLIARFVAQDVAAAETKTGTGAAVLARLAAQPPQDVADYFRQQLAMLKDSAQEALTRQILGLLLVTAGGISAEELADVLAAAQWDITDAVASIRRFLLGTERLELMHLELRRAVQTLFARSEQRSYRQKLLAWCRSYQEAGWSDDTPDYILYTYAQHLTDAIAGDSSLTAHLYALVDRRWMALKDARIFPHYPFAEDVDRAIAHAAAARPVDWVTLVRACLVYTTIRDRANGDSVALVDTLIRVGQVEQAHAYTGIMRNSQQRTTAFELMIDGDTESMFEMLKYQHQTTIPDAFGQAGAFTLEQMSAPSWADELPLKAEYLAGDAQILLHEGETTKAIEVASRALHLAKYITYERHKEMASTGVTYTGNISRALKVAVQALHVAASIEDDWRKAEALSGLALALAQAGEFKQALHVAASIEDDAEKAGALLAVSQRLAQSGDITWATQVATQGRPVAASIEEDRQQAEDLPDAAQALALAQAGDFEQALHVAASIEDKGDQAGTLAGVAQLLAQTGDTATAIQVAAQALQIVEMSYFTGEKAKALTSVGLALAQAGDPAEAEAAVIRAFLLSKTLNRSAFWAVFTGLVPLLAVQHKADTLWQLYDAITEVESWWSPDN